MKFATDIPRAWLLKINDLALRHGQDINKKRSPEK